MRGSVRERTQILLLGTLFFPPVQLLSKWLEQRPSNNGDLECSVTGKDGGLCYTGVDLLLSSERDDALQAGSHVSAQSIQLENHCTDLNKI